MQRLLQFLGRSDELSAKRTTPLAQKLTSARPGSVRVALSLYGSRLDPAGLCLCLPFVRQPAAERARRRFDRGIGHCAAQDNRRNDGDKQCVPDPRIDVETGAPVSADRKPERRRVA